MTTDHRPVDLARLDEDEQHREVFAWAGLALYMAQVVEHGLIDLVLVARMSDPRLRDEFPSSDDFFDQHFRLAMGRLIKAAQRHVDLPSDIEEQLSAALRLRNFVAHRFFRERIELFVSEEGRRIMLEELEATVHALRRLDAMLEGLVVDLGVPFGVTRERIEEMAIEMRRNAQPPSAQ